MEKKEVIEEQNKPNYDNREIHEHWYTIKLKKKVLYGIQKWNMATQNIVWHKRDTKRGESPGSGWYLGLKNGVKDTNDWNFS